MSVESLPAVIGRKAAEDVYPTPGFVNSICYPQAQKEFVKTGFYLSVVSYDRFSCDITIIQNGFAQVLEITNFPSKERGGIIAVRSKITVPSSSLPVESTFHLRARYDLMGNIKTSIIDEKQHQLSIEETRSVSNMLHQVRLLITSMARDPNP